MIVLKETRRVRAPRGVCFDLVRSVDAHVETSRPIGGRAEGGRRTGLSNLGDETRWSAVYFGIRFHTRLRTDVFDWPVRYGESNVGGPFRVFRHRYTLAVLGEGETLLTDVMTIESPWGSLGAWVDRWILGPRLRRELARRMDRLQQIAEGSEWRKYVEFRVAEHPAEEVAR